MTFLRLKYLLLLFLFSACTGHIVAQFNEPLHRHYSALDGLSSNEVYDVLCDSRGFLWFATNRGVSTFDGRAFRNFTTDDGLGDNSVLGLFEDYKGRIWCRTISGIVSYIENGAVYTIEAKTKVSYPNSIYVGDDDVLRVGCHEEGVIYQISPPYRDENVLIDADSSHDIRVLRFDDGFCFSRAGLAKPISILSAKGMLELPVTKVSSAGSKVRCLNDLIVYSSQSWLTIILGDKVKEVIDMEEDIANVFIDDDHSIWVCYANSAGVVKLPSDFRKEHGVRMLKGHSVSDVQKDLEGGYWFSTVNEGIYYAPDMQIGTLQTSSRLRGTNYLFGDASNVLVTDYAQSVLIENVHGQTELTCSDVIAHPELVPDGIFPILKKSGFIHFDNSVATHVKPSPDFLRFFETTELLVNSPSNMATGSLPLICFEADLTSHNILKTYRTPSRVNTFCASGDSLILGCVDGLYSFKNGVIQRTHLHFPELQTRIADVDMDERGRLWIATSGRGLYVLAQNKLHSVGIGDGLSSNICNRVRSTSDGALIANNHGLDQVIFNDRNELSVKNIASVYGLQGRAVNDFVLQYDQIIVQTEFGILKWRLDKSHLAAVPPRIYLTSVYVKDKDVYSKKNLILSHRDNEINFQFIAPVFRNSGSLMYRYKLHGIDASWHLTSYPAAQYPSLPSGKYLFEVHAVLPDGSVSEIPATYAFQIDLPFWRTWWFISLVAFLLAALIFSLTYLRIRNIKKKSAERERVQLRIASVEMKAIRAQMNPHFIFNCINSIQHFILNNDQMEAHKQLTRFSRLVRNVLENSDTEWISIERELETLKLYIELESMRFNSRFSFEIEVDDSIKRETDQIPPLAIQPFVENAILHGLIPLKGVAGKLRIHLRKNGNFIECSVEDNGIGRERAKEIKERKSHGQRSMGIELTIERLNRYSKMGKLEFTPEILIEDKFDHHQQPTGTIVRLMLPVKTVKP